MSKLLEKINNIKRKKYSIKDLGRIITGKTPSKNNPEDWGNEIDFITPTDFSSESKYLSYVKRKISSEGKARYKNMVIPPKSIIVTCIGSDMGKVIVSQRTSLTNQQINSIIINQDCFDVDFIYYTLKSMYPTLRSIAEEGGSTMPIITKSVFEKINFEAPDISIQKKIASLLNIYDEKIENNNKIIKNLEAMAQNIFNEWFVNFKFPGYEKVKIINNELGDTPEKWEVKNLNSVSDIVFGFNFKSNLFNESGLGVPVVRIRDILSGVTKTFSPEIPEAEYEIKSGDLLIGMDGIFHYAFWYSEGAFLNQRVARVRSDLPGYFIYEAIKEQLNFLQKTIIGATVGHLSNGDIRGFRILIPKEISLLQVFENITKEVLVLRKENTSLNSQRDQLLVKLI
ncbi:MAG: restriction endonuclease subunit S [Candidatus Pacebacteria bacterium]|nr:restriction endonuclease subunit S [Candidatus Paceibacterota bacterium]